MKTENKIKVWTHFKGKNEDLRAWMREWDALLGSDVMAYWPQPGEPWYCEVLVTQDQIDEFSMDRDWFTI